PVNDCQLTLSWRPLLPLRWLTLILFDYACHLARANFFVRAGHVGGTDRARPNHINLASRGRLSKWLLAAYHRQSKSASSCRILNDVRESGSARVGHLLVRNDEDRVSEHNKLVAKYNELLARCSTMNPARAFLCEPRVQQGVLVGPPPLRKQLS